MAGDWIKIRTDLFNDPDVMKMSDILGTDDSTTVGQLVHFWSWANKQTADGACIPITASRLDKMIGRPGFTDAMRSVGWLVGDDGGLGIPLYDRHNGSSAKARALESEAKRLRRNVGHLPDILSDKCRTKKARNVRPEKRREEKSIVILSNNNKERPYGSAEFLTAWSNWEIFRKEKRRTLTPSTVKATFKKFTAWGERKSIASIEQSIAEGWQGLFEPKVQKPTGGNHAGIGGLFTGEEF